MLSGVVGEALQKYELTLRDKASKDDDTSASTSVIFEIEWRVDEWAKFYNILAERQELRRV